MLVEEVSEGDGQVRHGRKGIGRVLPQVSHDLRAAEGLLAMFHGKAAEQLLCFRWEQVEEVLLRG
jgi:hypothetical protein